MKSITIPGQPLAEEILNKQLKNDRITHAYLLSGPRGTGKSRAEQGLLAHLNCLNLSEKACGECISCRLLAKGEHPDVETIVPEGASIKIAQMRKVSEKAGYSAQMGGFKSFIFKQTEKMTPDAANSMLKLFEDPPEKTIFILETENTQALPQTIVSRCQEIRFFPLSKEIMELILRKENNSIAVLEPEKLTTLLNLAEGSLTRAVEFLEETEAEKRKELFQLLDTLEKKSFREIISWVEKTEKSNKQIKDSTSREETRKIVALMLSWYRDLLVWKLSEKEELIINRDFFPLIANQSLSGEKALSSLKYLREKTEDFSHNPNIKLFLWTILLKQRIFLAS